MKSLQLFPLLILTLSSAALAADPVKPAAAPNPEKAAAAKEDFSKFATADALWTRIKAISAEVPPRPKTREEFMANLSNWLERQQAGAEAFLKMFPADPRRWDAKAVTLMTAGQLQQIAGKPVDQAAMRTGLEEIIAAPDASSEAKSEAAYLGVQLLADGADPDKPETVAALQEAVTAYLTGYSESKRAPEIANLQISILQMTPGPKADEILKTLAASSNKQIAELASQAVAQQQRMTDLKTKPLELKFTAVDGSEFDIAKLRGKVVLVDFWASWCGPCIAEAPNVVSTYKKLHDKGFEIVGISLDQDKAAMEGAMKKHGMVWPQHFDGGGWQNKISQSFGIESIPATWLVDKKGLVRFTEARGEVLGQSVEKLLAE